MKKLVIVLVFLVLIGCNVSPAEPVKVMYWVGGQSDISIVIRNVSEDTESHTVRPNWSKTFTAQPGQFLYLSAQNGGGDSVTCRILVNNDVVSEAKSTTKYGIAGCDFKVP